MGFYGVRSSSGHVHAERHTVAIVLQRSFNAFLKGVGSVVASLAGIKVYVLGST
jgi:hypothetical protein